jgi:hypothetical protein
MPSVAILVPTASSSTRARNMSSRRLMSPNAAPCHTDSFLACSNLGGMGCSAGGIAIDLARDMLQVHRST